MLAASNIMHRDVGGNNLFFADNKLYLIDFEYAVPKRNIQIKNPTLSHIKAITTFAERRYVYPERRTWNDILAVARVYEALAPLLQTQTTPQDISDLYALAKKSPTIKVEFIVDEDWKRSMRWDYLKLRLRPAWTCKRNSRLKRDHLKEVLKTLM